MGDWMGRGECVSTSNTDGSSLSGLGLGLVLE